jgi:hypothetical protein
MMYNREGGREGGRERERESPRGSSVVLIVMGPPDPAVAALHLAAGSV